MLQSPRDAYNALVANGHIDYAAQQQPSLAGLQRLWESLVNDESSALNDRLGVYLWGSVGRGKTLLMDIFYDALPEGVGQRQHFHHFMSALHRELNTTFGVANPLKQIAARFAADTKVICFDEFFVNDIADAMLLGNLIEALFEQGVRLVATSNIPISGLFQEQLQKERFAPAIELLTAHLESFHLQGEQDYRLRFPIDQPTYFVDFKRVEQQVLHTLFAPAERVSGTFMVNHRALAYEAKNEVALWCQFAQLCEQPCSAQDYIVLAETFDCIVITNIPELSSEPFEHIKARGTEDSALGSGQTGERVVSLGINDDAVRRFISLVDELYDQGVQVVFQACCPLEQLYVNGILTFEFQRTFSRITEMQTKGYQSRYTLGAKHLLTSI